MKWIDGDKPDRRGFYAIRYSWTPEEGTFYSSYYYEHNFGFGRLPVFKYAGPFETEQEADDFADKADDADYADWLSKQEAASK